MSTLGKHFGTGLLMAVGVLQPNLTGAQEVQNNNKLTVQQIMNMNCEELRAVPPSSVAHGADTILARIRKLLDECPRNSTNQMTSWDMDEYFRDRIAERRKKEFITHDISTSEQE